VKERPPGIDPDFLELEFVVRREYAGWRADLFISNRIPRLSRTRVQKILRKAAFDENGRPVKPNRKLAEGERITIYRPAPDEPDVPRHFGVLFEDEFILAVDKPAGLPVHPTARYHRNTLTAVLREQYGEKRPILAHRIDSETSGVVLCAKTSETERALKIMFANHQVQKRYLAVVYGAPSPEKSRIEVPLGFDTEGPIRVKMAYRENGLPSLTEYQVIKNMTHTAFLECRPRTGRQHQIRVHLAHIGHPIVGDKMYGEDPSVFLDYLVNGLTPDIEQRAGAKRQALHAASVSFVHPHTEEQMVIESPLPEDIQALLE
jgi:23S rRNA pseudouridine1911/1915/1917 synthase